MKRYYIEPKSFNIKNIANKEFCKYSFSAKDYRKLVLNNSNTKPLLEFVSTEFTGREISSENYIKKSKHRFLKTVNIGSWFCLDEESIEYCIPVSKVYPQKWDILIAKDGAGKGLGEVVIYNKENSSKLDSISAGTHCIRIDDDKRFYILGLLKSNHFKTFMDLNTAQGSTIRHSKKMALNYPVTFPSRNNNPNPKSIEKVVSLIVQNIIDKEEQIQIKNKKINGLIETELRENQKNGKPFIYSYPRIAQIRDETRLDTGLYEKEHKEIKFLIENYKNGLFNLLEKDLKGGHTPKKRFFGLGSLWLTPTDCKKGIIKQINLIKTLEYNLDNDCLVIVNRSNVAETVLFEKGIFKIGHHNQGMYRVLISKDNFNKRIFTLCWFNSRIFQQYVSYLSTGATFKEIRIEDITKKSYIPLFPENKQKEIAKEYYSKIEKNLNLTLNNYLEIEKQRNRKLGIFQLNMEIFKLREKLDAIINKMIRDKEISVNLNY